ncbi:MAG: hypothetical protein ACRENE_15720 [Polyangiaceae bacterium]
MTLDPVRLPRAAAYLASLPQGLESFPGCRVRDVTVEPYARAFGAMAEEPGLPAPLVDLFAGVGGGSTYPEVVFQAAHLVVRDRVFEDDAPFYEWIFNANANLFDRPIVRSLMRLVSPSLIVLGAAKRWGAFHHGSELTTDRVVISGDRAETFSHLAFPSGLFSSVFLGGLEHVFMAALLASRARDPRVKLARVADTGPGTLGGHPIENQARATYQVSWQA